MNLWRVISILSLSTLGFVSQAGAQVIPRVTIGIDQATKPGDVAITLQILFLMTVLSLAPALLIMTTSFTRIIVVFHFLRQALGTQQTPPNQLLVGLSLFLTFFVMSPVWEKVNDDALQPYLTEQIPAKEAFQRAIKPMREFMLRQTRQKEIGLFFSIAKLPKPTNADEVPMKILIPAFIASELRIAFQIGFTLYIPLLIIDMVVASILMSMGMLMLPPVMVSFPFKIMLFVLVDGWYLIIGSVVSSFR
ncbi:MAG: flagellar type III secretion system pore protein FliP [Candidatus Latescibacteria bacterium]|nr:flagellar type III secretion system pore protein FliP [Candidatus Latescibacterota bacterium]